LDQHHYHLLVKSLEVDATINPGTFRSKVLLISSAAYVVLFGMLTAIATFAYCYWTHAAVLNTSSNALMAWRISSNVGGTVENISPCIAM
jgi:hypothetical protein